MKISTLLGTAALLSGLSGTAIANDAYYLGKDGKYHIREKNNGRCVELRGDMKSGAVVEGTKRKCIKIIVDGKKYYIDPEKSVTNINSLNNY